MCIALLVISVLSIRVQLNRPTIKHILFIALTLSHLGLLNYFSPVNFDFLLREQYTGITDRHCIPFIFDKET